jgi:hypothetical protein
MTGLTLNGTVGRSALHEGGSGATDFINAAAGRASFAGKTKKAGAMLCHGVNLSAIALTACLSLAPVSSANAVVINDDISVSRDELRGKCRRSGGTFKEQSNGVYLCVVKNGDSTTVVSCRRSKCNGIINPRKAAPHTIVAPNNVFRLAR